MFSPDDLTPVLIAVPYVAATVRGTVKGSLRQRLLAYTPPAYCRSLPWLCRR